jgi:hypothetical protein
MPRPAVDDLSLLASRLRLGIPLTGFDGREIPLCDASGRELDPIEAAHELLRSGACLLPPDEAGILLDATLRRAQRIEAASCIAGDPMHLVTARVTGVLVSAAIRATVMARTREASPTDLNQATLQWFYRHDLLRRQMLDADAAMDRQRLSA